MKEFILQHKKPRLHSSLLSEDKQLEIIDLWETEVSTSTNIPQTSSSASPAREPLEIIQHADASSSKEKNIFSKFLEIKQKNEALKLDVYNQFLKQTSTSQHRLLTAFDSEKGRMQTTFLQATMPFPKTNANYKKIVLSFDARQLHPIDHMDMHRQSG